MTAFSIFVMLKFFGHFVLPFQTFRFADYTFLLIAGVLLSSCGSSRDEDVTGSTTQPSTPTTPTTPSTPTNERPSDGQIGNRK